jgi:hypothetical protein
MEPCFLGSEGVGSSTRERCSASLQAHSDVGEVYGSHMPLSHVSSW